MYFYPKISLNVFALVLNTATVAPPPIMILQQQSADYCFLLSWEAEEVERKKRNW